MADNGQRINVGYIIRSSIKVGENEFVLGVHEISGQFVTWKCSNGNDYNWGHYFTNELDAVKDLISRAQDEIRYLEDNGKELPGECYNVLPSSKELIHIVRGRPGYTKIFDIGSVEGMTELADEFNENLGVTKAQAAAMLSGSIFGWGTPAADPKNYDDNGRPIRPQSRERDNER